uniref:Uncharacterized protein n=1 Tax=Romanomermis culicivorax TaxID=13658 RepID=A0A915HL43_ROMCU
MTSAGTTLLSITTDVILLIRTSLNLTPSRDQDQAPDKSMEKEEENFLPKNKRKKVELQLPVAGHVSLPFLFFSSADHYVEGKNFGQYVVTESKKTTFGNFASNNAPTGSTSG